MLTRAFIILSLEESSAKSWALLEESVAEESKSSKFAAEKSKFGKLSLDMEATTLSSRSAGLFSRSAAESSITSSLRKPICGLGE